MQAKSAIGDRELFVDANGAFSVKAGAALAPSLSQARYQLVRGAGHLRRSRRVCASCASMRRRAWKSPPANTSTHWMTARRMLEAGAVDVLQADATRCGGVTGFLEIGSAYARRITSICQRTAPQRFTATSPAPCRGCAISNGFTTTCASSRCCSTARRRRRRCDRARSRPTRSRIEFKCRDAERFRRGQRDEASASKASPLAGTAAAGSGNLKRPGTSRPPPGHRCVLATSRQTQHKARRLTRPMWRRPVASAAATQSLAGGSIAAPRCWHSRCWPTARSSIIAVRSRTGPCTRRSSPPP